MNDNDKQKPKDGKGQVSTRRKVAIGALVAVALVALCLALTSVIPSPSSEQPTTDEPKTTVEVQSAQNEDDGQQADASSDAAEQTCDHDWTITYKTVHHDAVTHTETVAPVYANETSYHTVCNDCKQVIDGKADEHIKETGHSGYSTNVPITDEVVASEGYTKEVTDTPAYDETVPDKVVCTKCGVERPVDTAGLTN